MSESSNNNTNQRSNNVKKPRQQQQPQQHHYYNQEQQQDNQRYYGNNSRYNQYADDGPYYNDEEAINYYSASSQNQQQPQRQSNRGNNGRQSYQQQQQAYPSQQRQRYTNTGRPSMASQDARNTDRPIAQQQPQHVQSNQQDQQQQRQRQNNRATTDIPAASSASQQPQVNRQDSASSQKTDQSNSKQPRQRQSNGHRQHKPPKPQKPKVEINETRSEILIDQLLKNKCECLVCCSIIRSDAAVWNCTQCYQMFHMYCIKKWAQASLNEQTQQHQWRCPYCQTLSTAVPNRYTCFCSKQTNPEHNKNQIPHSCGEVCGKANSTDPNCPHRCKNLCHPGPCNVCELMVTRSCGCDRVKFQVKCNSTKVPECGAQCNKLLNCQQHRCSLNCHSGPCKPCDVDIEQTCCSHGHKRTIKCGQLNFKQQSYECSLTCARLLSCGVHKCERTCHTGACDTCALSPERLKTCPCGKTSINELLNRHNIRTKCTDPIPTCTKQCGKPLRCSSNDEPHFCQNKCHNGECSVCEVDVQVSCRCGNETDTMKCSDAQQQYKQMPKLCKKKCSKKKTCGRHKCTETCCNYTDHICTLICGRDLSCGLHKCDQLCHKGVCPNCLIASFEELSCTCGKTIMYPPIRCGTKKPECTFTCTRQHACEHPVQHNCHNEDKCPPCTYLTSKMCVGAHVLRNNIPCYMKEVSCGMQCDRVLPCGKHKCQRTCHKGDCLAEGETCTQTCQDERPHCPHPCLSPCHVGKQCPDTVCQTEVLVKCSCGLRSQKIKCLQKTYDSQNVVFENLAGELKEMLSCKTIDIGSFRKADALKKKYELPCDEECMLAERNRNLTDALQIDLNAAKKTIYSDFLKTFAREDLDFVLDVEKVFTQLYKETQNSLKIKKFEANFPTMKSLQRKFIHELSSYYGFTTQSYDKDPNRNVKVYACKDECHMPSVLLSQSIEQTRPKPIVMPHVSNINKDLKVQRQSNMRVLTRDQDPFEIKVSKFHLIESLSGSNEHLDNMTQQQQQRKQNSAKDIDYFDFTD